MSKNYNYFYHPIVMSFGINLGGDVAERQRGSRFPGAAKNMNNFMLI